MGFSKRPNILYLTVISALFLNAVLGAPGPEEGSLEVPEAKEGLRCVLGYQWNGVLCVHPVCALRFYWNGLACVPIEGGLHPCSIDYYWNGSECIHDNVLHHCSKLFYWNGASCIRDTGLHPCVPGRYWDGSTCTFL